ncbi:uncharacterized protein HLK63_J01067 [Nakaseomyces glabratus]|nr:uncharacterized protein GW608_J01067 [Nakaseomyces glabratus]UCS26793.1 uncharacterized protein HLK63_J01067 [Nakaseomyces glabratus]UCS32022.1 uncharacterized protein HLK64_J01067 [Nakaseomyces glabratus]UCS37251.1 uncharacterized protein HLK62_J01067 [Nakaseomyces glabratus]
MLGDSLDYDPTEDITGMLMSRDSLESLDELISVTRSYKLELSEEIKQLELEDSGEAATESDALALLQTLIEEYEVTKETSMRTQQSIMDVTQGISRLDNAKQNLSQTMSFFQNLKILTDCYIQCKQLLDSGSFRDMVSPYRIMYSLAGTTFAPYKSVQEINKLLTSVNRLKSEVFDRIKQKFQQLLSQQEIPPQEDTQQHNELRDGACELLDSDQSAKSTLIDWFISKLLYEMNEIFQVDDEAGSLENLARRYIYFKRVLNNFHSNLEQFFLPSWDLPMHLTETFMETTRKDLNILLKREFQDKSPTIDLFMNALQETLEFENYINVRFSKKLNDKPKLSTCFQPYLSVWVSHQDKLMDKKLLSYMSDPKFPENSTDSFIVPSSADLFRNYRAILTQSLELVQESENTAVLTALATFFTKWLGLYANKILEPLILPDNVEVEDKRECAKYTVLVINTAGYCSTTIEQLEERLLEFTSASEQINGIFMQTKSKYDDLAAKGINFLLNRLISVEISFVWREFKNVDWSNVMVEDYSRYMQTLKTLLKVTRSQPNTEGNVTILEYILKTFNRDIYKWNFMDKVINLAFSEFLGCILKLLQPTPPYASATTKPRLNPRAVVNIGEQLMLDLDLLSNILNSIPENMSGDGESTNNSSMKRTKKRIESDMDKLMKLVKLLIAPVDSPETYAETYNEITGGNDNSVVWAFILSLKAVPWDLEQWRALRAAYKTKLDERKEEGKPIDHSMLIMEWDSRPMMQFQANICRIQDPEWSKLVRNELRIHPPARTIQRPVTPQPQEPRRGIRELVSNSKLFER